MTIKLGGKRCRRCEDPVHIKDYKFYCERCGFQPPYDRDGAKPKNVSRETSDVVKPS